MKLSARKYLNIDPRMIEELATGMEDGKDVALRWGFTEAEWEVLKEDKNLNREVDRKIAENQQNGNNFRNKARYMSEVLLDNVFRSALDGDTPVKDKATALQILSRLGDLEPRNQVQAQGAGFSISISIPAGVIINETKKEVVDAEEAVEVKEMQLSFGQPEGTAKEGEEGQGS